MNEWKRVDGKVAIITGGGSGIGRGAALKLAEHGAKICLLDRTVEEAEEVVRLIEQRGGEAIVVKTDVSGKRWWPMESSVLPGSGDVWTSCLPMPASTGRGRRSRIWKWKSGRKRSILTLRVHS